MGSGVFPVLQWCPPGMTSHIFVPSLLAIPKWNVWIADNAAIIYVIML
jgi:hypothetical protein